MKKFLIKHKDAVILTTAIIVPFGVIALGVWKAVELINSKKEKEKDGDTKDKPE